MIDCLVRIMRSLKDEAPEWINHRQKECFDFLYKIPYTTYVAPVHYAYVGRSEGLNELQNHCPPQRAHRREKMAYPRRGKCIHI